MAALDDLAAALFGGRRAETNSVLTDGTTHTYVGTATSDSQDGHVMVELSGDVTNPEPIEIDGETYYSDADTSVELPTTTSVQEGDEVLVSVYGGTPLRSPVVTGVVGSGDRIAGMAQDAYDLADSVEGIAQQALDVANATGQHFWSDTDGAHVTELERSDWETQQTGANSLWNSLGMLFRDGLNSLLALLPGRSTTETFTVISSTGDYYQLANFASSITSVEINGVSTDRYDYTKVASSGTSAIDLFATAGAVAGDTLSVTYIPESSVALFDGAGNVVASFAESVINLAQNGIDTAIRLLGGRGVISAYDLGTDGEIWMDINAYGSTSIGSTQVADTYPSKSSAVTANAYAGTFSASASTRQAHLVSLDDKSAEVLGKAENGGASLAHLATDYYTLGGGGTPTQESYGALLGITSERGSDSTLAIGYRDASDAYHEESFALSDVIEALTQDQGTITLTNASTTRAHECFRRGWTVQVNITTFQLNAALATGRNVTIGTIPAGFRPSVGTFEAPYCNNATYAGRVFVSAGTDGNIVLFNYSGSSLPTSVTFTASFTYIVS